LLAKAFLDVRRRYHSLAVEAARKKRQPPINLASIWIRQG
jgi:hypothetical protein